MLRYYQEEAVNSMTACQDNGVVVLPTGSGKSHVLRGFVENYDGGVLILSHVKEILEQNFQTLVDLPDVGLYSAGLGIKKIDRITVAGIQSVWKHPELFYHVSVVLIDECHMISDAGMYHEFLSRLGVKYLGLTATPYRLKEGYIYKSGLFDSVCYTAPVSKLTKEGYLSPLEVFGSVDEFDTEGLTVSGGDFNLADMSLRYNRKVVTDKIVDQLTKYKKDYKHWLLFCIDIDHAEQVSARLNEIGITSKAVHSKSPRDQAILDFKSGKIQALTNVNILTVGFDFPEIDLIVMLRPTKSPTLHVQSIGRGLRMADGKTHCLIKDFAGNIKRLGMIDNLYLDPEGKAKKPGTGESKFVKTCPDCERICHPSIRVCECGHKFQFKHNLSVVAHKQKDPVWYDVTKVLYTLHAKPGSPVSMKVTYVCGLRMFNEWVLIEHPGFAGHKASYWVKKRWRGQGVPPNTTKGLIENSNYLWEPKRVRIEESGKYPKIVTMV